MKYIDIYRKYFQLKSDRQVYFAVKVNSDYNLNVTGIYCIKTDTATKLPEDYENRTRYYFGCEYFDRITILGEGLSGPYHPSAENCFILDTVVPDSMDYEMHQAVKLVKEKLSGSINEYIKDRLNYTDAELCRALSAEQVDAVAMCIYNIEFKRQGCIVGDQTGIGKGRVAASMIRYACNRGLQPIFITEKANLFSDIYRDLKAIGSGNLVPFIVNAQDPKTHIKDENGEIIYKALPAGEQKTIFTDLYVPKTYDFVVATYSQFNSPDKKPVKPIFLSEIAKDNIMILDESHNASGSSKTGEFMQSVVGSTRGVTFLSATFAKRPDNMPVYAMRTAIAEANMSKEELVKAILKGGVALQEIVASLLVKEGQMIRRERSFEGVEVNYITLDAEGSHQYGVPDKEQEHKAIADNITSILRDIIGFQLNYIDREVKELDKIVAAEGKEAMEREGTSRAGVDNKPYFSKVFNVINQMLFSIKAEAVADRAIRRLKEGKKPVIAFSSTMGSFLEGMENERGMTVSNGDVVNADFTLVLQKGLDGVMRYSVRDVDGTPEHKTFNFSELPAEARAKYLEVSTKIKEVSSGITISPIDVIIQKIQQAGYSCAEVTGRKLSMQLNMKTGQGLVMTRNKINANDAFRQFNNNEVDCLLINQSGSTGASAHAIVTDNVPADEVKQRVMIVLQPELNINTEVQKRGRINRTGQIYKPIYDYITSAIPAELRLLMMLQKKLKSLDANTASNQKQSDKIINVEDFLNKYGDKVVWEYLKENPDINAMLDDPLGIGKKKTEETEEQDEDSDEMTEQEYEDMQGAFSGTDSESEKYENAAHRVSGRVAVLSTKDQEHFYRDISERYNSYVDYLKQTGDYDLEVEVMNLEAETQEEKVLIAGKGGNTAFGEDSILEKVEANVLKKPFTKEELDNLIKESLQGKNPVEIQTETISEYEDFVKHTLSVEIEQSNSKYEKLIKNVPDEKKIKKLKGKERSDAIAEREKELQDAKQASADMLTRSAQNRADTIRSMFKFFTVGRGVNFPISSYHGGQYNVKAVFLGFAIDKSRKNPYAPSAIKLRFALSDSNKYFALPGSYEKDVSAIKGESAEMSESERRNIVYEWDALTKKSQVNRTIRFIITGNLLQAFDSYHGKLVSYTMIDGGTKKGILMPENWSLSPTEKGLTVVPISKAIRIIKSLSEGSLITTNTKDVTIMRTWNNFRISVPASKKRGGGYYLNEDILNLVDDNNFNKVSDQMVATLDVSKIGELVDILQKEFSSNVTIRSSQFDMIKDDEPEQKQAGEFKVEWSAIVSKIVKTVSLHDRQKMVAGLAGAITPKTMDLQQALSTIKAIYPVNGNDALTSVYSQIAELVKQKTNDFRSPDRLSTEPLDILPIIENEGVTENQWKQSVGMYKLSEADAVRWVADQIQKGVFRKSNEAELKAKRIRIAEAEAEALALMFEFE